MWGQQSRKWGRACFNSAAEVVRQREKQAFGLGLLLLLLGPENKKGTWLLSSGSPHLGLSHLPRQETQLRFQQCMHVLASSPLLWSQAVASRATTRDADLCNGCVEDWVEGLETELHCKAAWGELGRCLCLFTERVLPNKLTPLRERLGCM